MAIFDMMHLLIYADIIVVIFSCYKNECYCLIMQFIKFFAALLFLAMSIQVILKENSIIVEHCFSYLLFISLCICPGTY